MNLIEKFENMPFQDVETFNRIFKTTPILNKDKDLDVRICELTPSNMRRLVVGEETMFLDLTQKKNTDFQKKKKVVNKKSNLKKVLKVSKKLPDIYKILRPTEFMIYSAIKEAGEIHGVEELSRQIFVSNKSILANIPRLIELKLIKKEYVACDNKAGSFNKLSIVKNNT
jgi:DNA-binding MarR family transcriptional regulator